MKISLEVLKEEVQKELAAYKAGSLHAKSYFISMKEISAWLKQEGK
jgi:hypothetical protein